MAREVINEPQIDASFFKNVRRAVSGILLSMLVVGSQPIHAAQDSETFFER
ncbi:MAG: hypothetical protein CEO21_257 [Microgenomates group bacterium Gr01-1014_80]|nr:MAG: hypothetical protein CEO21_257 [Microgenomates group bacterium Gr01-1014_80]